MTDEESVYRKAEEKKEETDRLCKKVSKALKAKGIRISVGGCGCCGSPWFRIEVDGEIVADVDSDFNLNMFEAPLNMWEAPADNK